MSVLLKAGFTLGAALAAIILYLRIVRGYKWRDWNFLIKGLYLKRMDRQIVRTKKNVPMLWDKLLQRKGRNWEAFSHEDRILTLGEAEDLTNQIARWALSIGLKAGDIVGIYMFSRPEYLITWMGLAKIGVRSALINFNLISDSLFQSLQVSNAKILIFGSEVQSSLKTIVGQIKKELKMELFCYGNESKKCDFAQSLDNALIAMPRSPVPKAETAFVQGVTARDPLLYIYTSGTTGLPKAAIMTHKRFQIAAHSFSTFLNITDKDIVYCSLPLYHSSAGVIGVGMFLVGGAKLIIKSKFSASQFWPDIRKSKATVIQYIGEICRYTLAQPPNSDDGKNNVRLAVGNGLRPDIWKSFQERFKIPQIAEFYAATEGPAALLNTENQTGAIGFLSPLVSAVIPNRLVQYNVETDELVRNSKGFCVLCKPGEPGEFLAEVQADKKGKFENFAGYTSEEANKKKIARNVFKKGDIWFRSGDLLRFDKEGFAYFVDRIGDTFRWKGENVATTQVAEVVSSFPKCNEVIVYGVEIEGKEGRIGMATIATSQVDEEENDEKATRETEKPEPLTREATDSLIDWKGLSKHVCARLPSYSRPYFIRLQPKIQTTGTFKFVKSELRAEGFNIKKINDPIYFLDNEEYKYLDKTLYEGILKGNVRL